MKFSTTTIAFTTATLLTIMAVKPAAAFWPLDIFNKNEKTAQSSTANAPTLLDKIAEKFNLNQDEVEQVVTDYRNESRERMQSQYEERLNQAVTDGKITAEQKELILEKHNQLQSQWDAESQERQQHREEMQAWAEENNIDLSYLGFGMGMGRGGHGGMTRGEGMGMVRGR
jgi:uncharacterized protein (DUF39 family)